MLLNVAGPTIRRRQLGIELQRLREDAGIKRGEAAELLGCSPARMGHVEGGRNVLALAEQLLLLRDHYGARQETIDALEEMRKEASQRGWWSTYGLPEWLAAYVGLEHDAISMRTLELALIPGILQTTDYARRLHEVDPRLGPKEVERRVAARIQRQARLTDQEPLQLSAILDEAALIRCARQRDVAADQFRHLIDRAKLPNVELRVLPLDVGLYVGMTGAFSLLSFPDGVLPDVAYQEYAVGGHLVDADAAVDQLSTLFDEIRGQTLGANESLTLIADLVDQTS